MRFVITILSIKFWYKANIEPFHTKTILSETEFHRFFLSFFVSQNKLRPAPVPGPPCVGYLWKRELAGSGLPAITTITEYETVAFSGMGVVVETKTTSQQWQRVSGNVTAPDDCRLGFIYILVLCNRPFIFKVKRWAVFIHLWCLYCIKKRRRKGGEIKHSRLLPHEITSRTCTGISLEMKKR